MFLHYLPKPILFLLLFVLLWVRVCVELLFLRIKKKQHQYSTVANWRIGFLIVQKITQQSFFVKLNRGRYVRRILKPPDHSGVRSDQGVVDTHQLWSPRPRRRWGIDSISGVKLTIYLADFLGLMAHHIALISKKWGDISHPTKFNWVQMS